jgi:tRNA-splicing ligase RtcB (3'-phosphate/5'-hydroxy nucleic acid ligase)
MGNIRTKDLSKIGIINNRARSLAIQITAKHFKHHTKDEILQLLKDLASNPGKYEDEPLFRPLSFVLQDKVEEKQSTVFSLLDEHVPYKVYGGKHIDSATRKQMDIVMSLPIVYSGALMPDAHVGYGVPIGGVIATKDAVIPYAVGVDIGCRMALTIFEESATFFQRYSHSMKEALKEWTHFGMEGGLDIRQDHAVLEDPRFHANSLLSKLQRKASRQLGSSGSGNHFVEFGIVELYNESVDKAPGQYVALLSHSGSRGLGANIAQHYMRLASDRCRLPANAQSLAWLDMNSPEGEEYWTAMSLAGDYAKACHDRIHMNLAQSLGLTTYMHIENHHNFAWKEQMPDGTNVIVHRKGATPAHKGEWGIVPGSMTHGAYIVEGMGDSTSLYSASHGAGRALSRQRARENMTASSMKKMLIEAGVTLIGGSTEENPMAYKNIDEVVAAQTDLIRVRGKFFPKIVRMNKD